MCIKMYVTTAIIGLAQLEEDLMLAQLTDGTIEGRRRVEQNHVS